MKHLLTALIVLSFFWQNSLTAGINETRITASDSAYHSWYGCAVHMWGDYLVIGAERDDRVHYDSGAAYIYRKDSTNGEWKEEYKVTPSDLGGGGCFGCAVAIQDTQLLVGEWNDINVGNYNMDTGSVTVFWKTDSNWTEKQQLFASDDSARDQFGEYISISGKYAIISAQFNNDNGVYSGSAYIFKYDTLTGSWREQIKLIASDAAENDRFGCSVWIDGDYAIVGAHLNDDDGENSGSAYIFKRNPVTDTWSEQVKLTASNAYSDLEFGWSVSLSGDAAVVGTRVLNNPGPAYIFRRTGDIWQEEAQLMPNNPGAGDNFGERVSINGDFVLCGVNNHDVGSNLDQGNAYIFFRDSITGDWIEGAELVANSGAINDMYGWSVYMGSAAAVVGAPKVNHGQGAVSVFTGDMCTGIVEQIGPAIANNFKLMQNYPNPFNPETTILYSVGARISSSVNVNLSVYNILGQKVATLVNEKQTSGTYSVSFNSADLPSGLYFYKLQADNVSETKKMILTK